MIELLILSAVAFRLGWFIQRDGLIDEWRDGFSRWLRSDVSMWRMKVHYGLLECPHCVCIWTSLLATGLYPLATGQPWWGWAYIYLSLAHAAGALIFWRIIDD